MGTLAARRYRLLFRRLVRRRQIQEDGLQALEQATRAHRRAQEKMRREVLFAYEAGSSLRTIADVLQVSAETVRTIVREQRASREKARLALEQPIAALTVDDRHRAIAARRRLAKDWCLSVQDLDR